MALVGDGELAVTESVPQLDGAVARAGDDLSVVGGEGDGENIVGVANEAAGGGAGGELPEAEGLVPGRGESVGTIGGDNLDSVSAFKSLLQHLVSICQSAGRVTYTVGDDVGVTVEDRLGVTVRGLVAGQVPDDEGLVAGTRQEHVGAGRR